MKNYYYVVLLSALFVLAGCQESLEEKCARECKAYTQKNCPAQLDDKCIVDSLIFESNSHTLHYYYTLTGIADSVGLLNPEEVKTALLDQLSNTTSMKAYKDAGYSFAYTYYSQKRPELVLFDVKLSKKDYGSKK
jgi:hypothetical protein